MAPPLPVPTNTNCCVLYGYVRDATRTPVSGLSVLINSQKSWPTSTFLLDTAVAVTEGTVDMDLEVLTDVNGFWKVEVPKGATIRVQIIRLKVDVTNVVPDAVRQDFFLWAFQPSIRDSRQYIADPVNAPTVTDTSVIVRVESTQLANVMTMYEQVKLFRSSTRNGVYVEVTAPTTRLELVDGQIFYEFTQNGVAPGYWYRAAFYNATNNTTGPMAPPFKAQAPDYASVLTVDELKEHYLFGVNLTDDFGNPYPRSMFEHYIRDAIGWMERQLTVSLRPQAAIERQDFQYQEFAEWGHVQLDNIPVIGVDKLEFMLGEQVLWEVPQSWLQYDKLLGTLHMIPAAGAMNQVFMSQAGKYIGPGVIMFQDQFPGFLRLTYRHGFLLGTIPEEVKACIAMQASLGPLNIAGDLLVGAGIASVSVSTGGASQSIGTTSCFVAGSLVQTVLGPVPIEQVKVGMQVIGWYVDHMVVAPVTAAWSPRSVSRLVDVALTNGDTFRCTLDHLWATSTGYVCAADLTKDDVLIVAGDPVCVDRVDVVSLASAVPVFDLEVPATHNFGLRSANSLVFVHNSATNAGYGARVIQYTNQIKARMPGLIRHWRGIRGLVA